MAMLDGVPKKPSGGNAQRERFNEESTKNPAPKAKPASEPDGDESTTTIKHNGDGSYTATHSDGETSEHPNMGHLAMALHAKHGDGEAMHVQKGMDGVTTHHVGLDGQVQGPDQHGTMDEATQHMTQMLGEDGGNGAIEMTDGADAMPPEKSVGQEMPKLF